MCLFRLQVRPRGSSAQAVGWTPLKLKTIAPWGDSDGNSKVRRARMEVRRKFFSDSTLGSTALGKGNNIGYIVFVTHSPYNLSIRFCVAIEVLLSDVF